MACGLVLLTGRQHKVGRCRDLTSEATSTTSASVVNVFIKGVHQCRKQRLYGVQVTPRLSINRIPHKVVGQCHLPPKPGFQTHMSSEPGHSELRLRLRTQTQVGSMLSTPFLCRDNHVGQSLLRPKNDKAFVAIHHAV
eukprot:9267747-Pyramimonas_sp.AAC.1